jgi:hypothetical protein
MGSPMSGILAEILLQLIEEQNIKHWMENGDLLYYKRYVDDIFIIYDSRNTDHSNISKKMSNINTNLEFKIVTESNQSINYLDMTITRTSKDINIDIYSFYIQCMFW